MKKYCEIYQDKSNQVANMTRITYRLRQTKWLTRLQVKRRSVSSFSDS